MAVAHTDSYITISTQLWLVFFIRYGCWELAIENLQQSVEKTFLALNAAGVSHPVPSTYLNNRLATNNNHKLPLFSLVISGPRLWTSCAVERHSWSQRCQGSRRSALSSLASATVCDDQQVHAQTMLLCHRWTFSDYWQTCNTRPLSINQTRCTLLITTINKKTRCR